MGYTVRNLTTTNTCGGGYVAGTTINTVARWFTSIDLTGQDIEATANFNGVSADGTILLSWLDGEPTPPDLQS
jgi:hypothetical protein